MASTFAVSYTYTYDTALRDATRPADRDYLRGLADDGGAARRRRLGPAEAPPGLLIFRGEDKAAVQAIVDKDPFTTAGVVAGAEVRRWAPPLGPMAAPLNGR